MTNYLPSQIVNKVGKLRYESIRELLPNDVVANLWIFSNRRVVELNNKTIMEILLSKEIDSQVAAEHIVNCIEKERKPFATWKKRTGGPLSEIPESYGIEEVDDE